MDDDEEIMLVCMPSDTPTHFTDNLVCPCSICGREVMHRPHAPMGVPRVCIYCAAPDIAEHDTFVITPETAREIREVWRKQRH